MTFLEEVRKNGRAYHEPPRGEKGSFWDGRLEPDGSVLIKVIHFEQDHPEKCPREVSCYYEIPKDFVEKDVSLLPDWMREKWEYKP